MADMPKFNNVVQAFIEQSIKTGASIGKIIDDIAEIYPQFQTAAEDENARDLLYQRIKKIKARLPQQKEYRYGWETIPHYLSADWRVTYFRALLNVTDDMNIKIRLLREIRTEVTIINKQNILDEPKRKADYEREQQRKTRQQNRMQNEAYNNAKKNGWIIPDTVFPIKAYEQIEKNQFRRKEDGIVIDKKGDPIKGTYGSHESWIEKQDDKLKHGEVYNYDPDDENTKILYTQLGQAINKKQNTDT